MEKIAEWVYEYNDGRLPKVAIPMSVNTRQFIAMVKDPAIRPDLLARLQELGLLSEFLEAEN